MKQSFHEPLDVLEFAHSQMDQGHAVALCVITRVTGGAMRARGTLMCITDNGLQAGYVSNGCVDGDIVVQARTAIETNRASSLRYGEGSPFKDIELPCGGAIELMILPRPDKSRIMELISTLHDRKPVDFWIDNQSEINGRSGDNLFETTYHPRLKIRIVGRGDAVAELTEQVKILGMDVLVQSPDQELLSELDTANIFHLKSPTHLPDLDDDDHTAVVFMFHDHDWEPALIQQALSGPAFYIGAMGSVKTHKNRLAMLRSFGIAETALERLHGPIGVIPSMRNAQHLALSTLAEIIQTAQSKSLL